MNVLVAMNEAIKRANVTDSVRVVRLLPDHASDHCGFDFAFVDKNTGRMLPLDATACDKFGEGLPALRGRSVVSIPDASQPDAMLKLWESMRLQQGLPAVMPMPNVNDMIAIRCDFVLDQLRQSPLRITDFRLFFDEVVDRHAFARKLTEADRQELKERCRSRKRLFDLVSGELINPMPGNERTLSAGLHSELGNSQRILRQHEAAKKMDPAAKLSEKDQAALKRSADLFERQVAALNRFVEDLNLLSRQFPPPIHRLEDKLKNTLGIRRRELSATGVKRLPAS